MTTVLHWIEAAVPARRPLISEKALADMTGLSPNTLQRMRREGTGPKYVRVGIKRLMYRWSDGEAWMTERENLALPPRGDR
jgi:predicted DNA-binding transcriptional regulator AlpA